MPNFTTKDLLIATALIAVGVAMTCFTFHWLAAAARASTAPPSILPQFACWFLGPALIGAGTLFPFSAPPSAPSPLCY